MANDQELLSSVPAEDQALHDERTWTTQQPGHAMLGLRWDPARDYFSFLARQSTEGPVTKQSILS